VKAQIVAYKECKMVSMKQDKQVYKDNKRVLLISPPYLTSFSSVQIDPPLGLLYLGTVLSKNDYEVKILDATLYGKIKLANGLYLHGMSNNEIVKYAKKYNPKIIGLGCLFSAKWRSLLSIADDLKKELSDIFVVAGGIYPSMEPEKSIDHDNIDFCIIGEAENSFLDLCNQISKYNSVIDIDESGFNLIKNIDGIVYKKNENIYINPKQKYIEKLDELPFPDYNLLEAGINPYFERRLFVGNFRLNKMHLSILTSRSCPNKCSFCNMRFVHGDKIRYRSAESVISEIEKLHTEYKISHFLFEDDNVSLNRKRFIDICQQIINLDFKIKWASENGLMVNTLDDEVISLMAKSGCVFVGIGVESGNEKIRSQVIGKPIKLNKIEKVFYALKKNNIFTQMFIIIGFYEDNDETIEDSIKLIMNIKPDVVSIHILQVYPRTELFDRYQSLKLISKDYDICNLFDELSCQNLELYQGYSQNVIRWEKNLKKVHFDMLLKDPLNFLKYYDYFLPKVIYKFGIILEYLVSRCINWLVRKEQKD
jgi:anaerobic magnesium-protoporphyrin IX monomethyl ester cyclase